MHDANQLISRLAKRFFSLCDEEERSIVVAEFYRDCRPPILLETALSWLGHTSPRCQYLGALLLGRGNATLDDARCLDGLAAFLQDQRARPQWVVDRALRSVGNLPLPAAETILLSLFERFFPQSGHALAESLATPRIIPPEAAAWDALLRLATVGDTIVREWAFFGIAERLAASPACKPPAEVVDLLREAALTDSSAAVRGDSIRSLICCEPETGLAALADALKRAGIDDGLIWFIDDRLQEAMGRTDD